MTEPEPPQDLDAERAVLGACMEWPGNYRQVANILTADDWYLDQHRIIWSAIEAAFVEGLVADPVILADRIGSGLDRFGGRGYLATLYEKAPAASALVCVEHANLVAAAAVRRRMVVVGKRIQQIAYSADSNMFELQERARKEVEEAGSTQQSVDVLTVPLSTFMHAEMSERKMIVPGLLGVGDRLVITGQGGLGKSTALLQLAVCAATGIPPLDWRGGEVHEPRKVMIMDHENPDHRVKTRLWPLLKMARDYTGMSEQDMDSQLTLGGHGNAIDLLAARDVLSLLRTIEHDKPDLLYIGPVYKMHKGDPDKEMVIKQVTDALDHIRAMGVVIITEAHHTKSAKMGGSLEPSGANLWTWWPEFGLGLRLDPDSDAIMRRCSLERWRYDREDSEWPEFITGGSGSWPWERCTQRRLSDQFV